MNYKLYIREFNLKAVALYHIYFFVLDTCAISLGCMKRKDWICYTYFLICIGTFELYSPILFAIIKDCRLITWYRNIYLNKSVIFQNSTLYYWYDFSSLIINYLDLLIYRANHVPASVQIYASCWAQPMSRVNMEFKMKFY